jgi:hypothetical protein
MPETLVLCGDVPPRRGGQRGKILKLDASPTADPRHRVGLQLETISKVFADNVPDILADMLEVAAYVYAADRLIGRGTPMLTDMGADWRRKIRLKIAVRSPVRWEAPEAKAALVEALEVLSEDTWDFEFLQTKRRTGIQPYLGFSDPQAHVIEPDVVMLFSGGLDSTAGLVEQLLGKGSRVAFVTHRSAKLLAGRQGELVDRIRQWSPRRSLFHVPIWVTKGEQEPIEFSQRTRSLLFAVLGTFVAQMFGRQEILFFENGITSFNLPIAEHVLGTRASRTTHPLVFRSLERVFSTLLETPIQISNPYLWKTKKDIVGILTQLAGAKLIAETVSCANVRQLPMTNKQCGVCVQCIERRFAIMACGLGNEDPAEGYAHDLFRSEHKKVEDVTMAECHALRAQKLASMSDVAFFASYGQVFRALSSLPGSAFENLNRIFDLHREYGRYIVDVLNDELRRSASLDKVLSLPATSLLAMINSPAGPQVRYLDPIEREPSPSVQAGLDDRPVRVRRFVVAIDAAAKRVIFADGPKLKGVAYLLFAKLAEQFVLDAQSERPKNLFTFIKTKELLRSLNIDEPRLRARVREARSSLRKQFVEYIDYLIDEQDIIQSRRWTGYRLNPHLVLVKASELRGAGAQNPEHGISRHLGKTHDTETSR